MKLQFRQIEPFVKSPDPAARVILVYGPDTGLVRERSKTMCLTIVSDINDPFNAVTLPGDSVVDDPARLMDEALAMSMMGGGRLIRIEGATDKLAPVLKEYLQNPSAQNLVVIEADELGKNSALRKLCEAAANAAAIPCYVEDERDIAPVIRDMLRAEGYMIEPDALSFLAMSAAGDRLRVRSETQKLIIYMGNAAKTITLEDVQACCGDAGAQTYDNLVYNTAGGRSEPALRAYHSLLAEGIAVTAMLRMLQSHFRKLHLTKAKTEAGENILAAMKSLSPPIFFKNENDFKAQLTRWSMPALEKALERLAAIEAQCKQTGTPDETLCAQALLSLSRSKGS